jgi:hypothetical protein
MHNATLLFSDFVLAADYFSWFQSENIFELNMESSCYMSFNAGTRFPLLEIAACSYSLLPFT